MRGCGYWHPPQANYKQTRSKNLSELYWATNDIEIMGPFKEASWHTSHSLLMNAENVYRRLCYLDYHGRKVTWIRAMDVKSKRRMSHMSHLCREWMNDCKWRRLGTTFHGMSASSWTTDSHYHFWCAMLGPGATGRKRNWDTFVLGERLDSGRFGAPLVPLSLRYSWSKHNPFIPAHQAQLDSKVLSSMKPLPRQYTRDLIRMWPTLCRIAQKKKFADGHHDVHDRPASFIYSEQH